jgi:molybdopterin synthase sulfur carrier subunit
MSVLIRIPTPLRRFTGGKAVVEAKGNTVSEILEDLDANHPGIRDRLYDQGSLLPLFSIYHNNKNIRVLNKAKGSYEIDMKNPVNDGDEISIIPPIAGGDIGLRKTSHWG